MRQMKITVGAVAITVDLRDTPTAEALWNAAPFSAKASLWGEEVYFSTPVSLRREKDARDVMALGEIAFWTDGDSIAIGWGPTPASRGNEIRLASPCNVWATTKDDLTQLKSVRGAAAITVERVA
jgi:hypothetical protein